MHGKVGLERQRARVDRWCRDYRAMAGRHRDADGRPPQHGFFYPEEEYLEEHLAKIESLCRDGYGEIEVHLHHDNDTEDNFRSSITRSEEHTSELPSLLRISYDFFCWKNKKRDKTQTSNTHEAQTT